METWRIILRILISAVVPVLCGVTYSASLIHVESVDIWQAWYTRLVSVKALRASWEVERGLYDAN